LRRSFCAADRWLRRSFYDRLETTLANGGFETGARAPSSTTETTQPAPFRVGAAGTG
jgi:hypothetical protein